MTKTLKTNLLAGTTAALAIMASGALAGPALHVTTTDNAGEGSLRWALSEAAKSADPTRVIVAVKGPFNITSTLTYEGLAPVEIIGGGQTVKANVNETLLAVTQGADLSISHLSFEGPAGFNIENRGDLNGQTAGKGIFVKLREDQSNTLNFTLNDVTVSGVAAHGVHISDCNLADGCGGGQGGAGDGSPAAINVSLSNVTISDVGNGRFDADGFRVDERGAGDITFTAQNSVFTGVGADGVELDEGQDGHVIATIIGSKFVGNGAYCNPDILASHMPVVSEGEFKDGQMAASAVPAAVTGTLDDGCFEREVELYPSGMVAEYEFGIDLDDGIDFDEAGDGNIETVMIGTLIAANFDEGVDFDEEGNGDMKVSFIDTDALDNRDDGFKLSEVDNGNVVGLMERAKATGNGGKGIVFEEENEGSLSVAASHTATSGNDDSDKTGIELVQEDEGDGSLTLLASNIADGIDVEGVNYP